MPLDVLLINPPFLTLTSVLGVGHQVPLGLLMVGGALVDAGVRVQLLDAESARLTIPQVVDEVRRRRPRLVMTGHAGSTAAHTTCTSMLRAIKRELPRLTTVYGGPYPTYHAREILHAEPAIDLIVRGEGEATVVDLVRALSQCRPLEQVPSLALRSASASRTAPVPDILFTPARPPLNMDDYRIAWELLDENHAWDRYQCFGLGRAVIVQFSRGCPHHCTYCGQRGFWMQWRHRDPVRQADEIEWLVRNRHVRFITLADENPTTLLEPWHRLLEEIAHRRLPVKFFSTIRASDIVRDRHHLRLWAAAGIQYVLLGLDATDEATLRAIRKGSTTRIDLEACRLLRRHGIYSMTARIAGLAEETPASFWQTWRQIRAYDGDYLNVMYVTPHAWTAFAAESRDRPVVDEDLAHWNYRRPVLGQRRMKPWQTFFAVKLLEFAFHLRPTRLWRMLTTGTFNRHQFFWGVRHIGAVWLAEIWDFLRHPPRAAGRPLGDFQSNLGACRHQERLTSLTIRQKTVKANSGDTRNPRDPQFHQWSSAGAIGPRDYSDAPQAHCGSPFPPTGRLP